MKNGHMPNAKTAVRQCLQSGSGVPPLAAVRQCLQNQAKVIGFP
jgi:ketol-acid reductoisomerase